MHRRRPAGHDRQIIRIGKSRHHAIGDPERTRPADPAQIRHTACGHRPFDITAIVGPWIIRLTAVDAHNDKRTARPGITAPVHLNTDGVFLFSHDQILRLLPTLTSQPAHIA